MFHIPAKFVSLFSLMMLIVVADKKLKLTLFYESLCGDCVDFFNEQVSPNLWIFEKYVYLDLVPYGNAKKINGNSVFSPWAIQQWNENGMWKFKCQHGIIECWGNRIQACARYIVPDKKKFHHFVSCFMSSKEQSINGPICARINGIDYASLVDCALSLKGNEYLAYFGNITHSFQPKVVSVPTIAFNDIFNSKDQKDSLNDLEGVICRKLRSPKPTFCRGNEITYNGVELNAFHTTHKRK